MRALEFAIRAPREHGGALSANPNRFFSHPHQRMAKMDDLLQRRAKQVVLTVVARLAHRSPLTDFTIKLSTPLVKREGAKAICARVIMAF
jgi:hypothetical protein